MNKDNIFTIEEKNNLINLLEKKWDYLDFITEDYLKEKFNNESKEEINNFGINKEVAAFMLVEQKIYSDINKMIKDGNVDVEIDVLDKIFPIARIIAKKMQLNYKNLEIEIKGEDGLIYALENYDGGKNFTLYATRIIKALYKGEDIEKKFSKPKDFKTCLEEISNNKESLDKENKNNIDPFFKKLQLEQNLKTKDENYTKFIILKYGYIDNKFFSIDSISKYLNISEENSIEYYINSLNLIKEKFAEKTKELDTVKNKLSKQLKK